MIIYQKQHINIVENDWNYLHCVGTNRISMKKQRDAIKFIILRRFFANEGREEGAANRG